VFFIVNSNIRLEASVVVAPLSTSVLFCGAARRAETLESDSDRLGRLVQRFLTTLPLENAVRVAILLHANSFSFYNLKSWYQEERRCRPKHLEFDVVQTAAVPLLQGASLAQPCVHCVALRRDM